MERRGIKYPRRVFDICLALAKQEGKTKDNRGWGHPPIYEEGIYLALSLFKVYFNLTFRATVSFYQDLFPEIPYPSFQALHRFLKRKVSSEQIKALFMRLREFLSPLLP